MFLKNFKKLSLLSVLKKNITHRIWRFPSAEGALIVLTLYATIFFLLGYLLFKRRQL